MQLDDLKILICDDSILARKQMKDIINSIGSPTIIEAANGQLAIDMYKEYKPNLTFIAAQLFKHGPAIHARQHNIQQNKRGLNAAECVYCRITAGTGGHGITFLFQVHFYYSQYVSIVINDQYNVIVFHVYLPLPIGGLQVTMIDIIIASICEHGMNKDKMP